MKVSTSRDSSVKHSTGNRNNDTMTKMNGRRRLRPRTSTGEKGAITHFTGRLSDLKHEEEAQEKKMTKRKPPQAA